jgi:hypothetical protein
MKAYLRDARTRLWYAGPEQWVVNRRAALGFDALGGAVKAAAAQSLDTVDIVLTDGGANGETVIPLPQPFRP